jgi:hypothetical protein
MMQPIHFGSHWLVLDHLIDPSINPRCRRRQQAALHATRQATVQDTWEAALHWQSKPSVTLNKSGQQPLIKLPLLGTTRPGRVSRQQNAACMCLSNQARGWHPSPGTNLNHNTSCCNLNNSTSSRLHFLMCLPLHHST